MQYLLIYISAVKDLEQLVLLSYETLQSSGVLSCAAVQSPGGVSVHCILAVTRDSDAL